MDTSEILRILGPGQGQDVIFNVMLYLIFFFALITLFIMPDKNMVPTLLIAGVLLFAMVAKLSLATKVNPILTRREFGMLVINVGMLVFPMIAAATIRAKKKTAIGPAIITGFLGFIYFFTYWLLVQRDG